MRQGEHLERHLQINEEILEQIRALEGILGPIRTYRMAIREI